MKVIVNIPLKPTREYTSDFIEETIPNVGEEFDDVYTVVGKTIDGDVCTLDVQRKENNTEAEWVESACGFDINCSDNYICSNCGHVEKLCTRYCSWCGKSMKDKKANWRCN